MTTPGIYVPILQQEIREFKMKKCFAFFLIICLLINICGCYPSTTILKEDYSGYISDSEKDLRITLRDGRTIISKSYEHLTVYEPSEFIIGKATITGLGEPELNVGTILLKSQIDSTNMNNGLNTDLVCYSGGKQYYFSSGHYFDITKAIKSGFRVRGTIEDSNGIFYGNPEPDEISDLNVIESKAVNTIFIITEIVLVGLLIALIVKLTTPPQFREINLMQ